MRENICFDLFVVEQAKYFSRALQQTSCGTNIILPILKCASFDGGWNVTLQIYDDRHIYLRNSIDTGNAVQRVYAHRSSGSYTAGPV